MPECAYLNRILNMPWVWKFQCQYSEYDKVLKMAGFSICEHYTAFWICQNMPWMYLVLVLYISEYASYNTQRKVTLQVITSTYWEIQNPVKDLRWSTLKKQLQFLTIFANISILNLWDGSEYVSGFKYVRVLNIHKFS